MKKRIYNFKEGKAEGRAKMKDILGGKGANLAEMADMGIPVPAGFTITTEVCNEYYENGRKITDDLKEDVLKSIKKIEKRMGMGFGDPDNPLLVSVRSGARVSMPGMMDTVLNLGLNENTLKGLIEKSENERFGWDSYRRFIQMFGDVVLGLKPETKEEEDPFEKIMQEIKDKKNVSNDLALDTGDLKEIAGRFKDIIKEKKGMDFPEDPHEQLWMSIGAVFDSWNNDRAKKYRKLNNIDASWGTAVNVQSMVFGNMGDDCATGVAFTRDPSTGEKIFYGEYLTNAQGEDVVAGIRTPRQLTQSGSRKWAENNDISEENRKKKYPSLEESMPEAFNELVDIYKKLENHYKEMQDMEFTIQNRKLWLLQTRTGKRTANAAIKIATDMVDENLIDKKEAINRIDTGVLDQLLHPQFDPEADKNVVAKGLPASPGAASGKIVFFSEEAEEKGGNGERVILVRIETSPEDVQGMSSAQGVLTARGGQTSHAAVVARGMGKCCVAGCDALDIDYKNREMKVNGNTVKEGDMISLDGTTGEVILGEVPTVDPELSGDFATLMGWADGFRMLKVRANADNPEDAELSKNFGAQGIGLCRTEHMFFESDRISAVREMILSDDEEARKKAISKLLPMQKNDFYEIFRAMEGKEVTIRLLDPPLHEFLPHDGESLDSLAEETGKSVDEIKEKIDRLKEFNPMLGHRGCRLGITYPEITEMQSRAIFEAACKCREEGIDAKPEIMIPLVSKAEEFSAQNRVITRTADSVFRESGVVVKYKTGTMIEVPRAAVTADKIAAEAEFFSFGTNDLTQMTFGYSRDDSGSFLGDYLDKHILDSDPFQVLDKEGVGSLVKMASEKGRKINRGLKLGICGEHGGEPSSIEFFDEIGLDYVSCSPYRVPVARLAAAQSAINHRK